MIATIVVPLDGSSLAEAALAHAELLAGVTGAEIVVVRVSHGGMAAAEADAYVDSVALALRERGIRVRTEVLVGHTIESICRAAAMYAADMIVMSTHGFSGLRHVLVGSIAEEVVRTASRPVLLVQPGAGPRQPHPRPFGKIVVPLDRSTAAERVVQYLAGAEFARDAEFLLLHCAAPAGAEPALGTYRFIAGPNLSLPREEAAETGQEAERQNRAAGSYLAGVAARYLAGRAWRGFVPVDDPVHAIALLAAAEHADLIAMTTHARAGFERMRKGNVAAGVLHHAGVPMLVLRYQDAAQGQAATTAEPSGVL